MNSREKSSGGTSTKLIHTTVNNRHECLYGEASGAEIHCLFIENEGYLTENVTAFINSILEWCRLQQADSEPQEKVL